MKKWIFGILITLTTAFVILGGYSYSTLFQTLSIEDSTLFTVSEDTTWKVILEDLQNQDIIRNQYTLGILAYIHFQDYTPKQGTYTLKRGETLLQVIRGVDRGIRTPTTVRITIPEGSRITEIADILSKKFDFSSSEFIQATESFDTNGYEFVRNQSLEGYLFPDTYEFFDTATPNDIIENMLLTFQRKVAPFLESTSDLDEYEVLILASIVEKEVFLPEDQAIVAGIFLNRLSINMRLQSDATVNYITQSGRTQSTRDDLAIESPYNTYQVAGLPPTPITNPGLSSIRAVLNPTESEYLFFLTTRENPPRTIFSETFEQHTIAKAKYLP